MIHRNHLLQVYFLLCMLSLSLSSCNSRGGSDGGTRYATTCYDFTRPARNAVYIYDTGFMGLSANRNPEGEYGYYGRLVLDDKKPHLLTDDDLVVDVYAMTRLADSFFRGLRVEGYGAWDGCYADGKNQPLITSVVYHTYTGWQGKPFGEIFYKESDINKPSIIHEVTHGLVSRTTGLWAQGGQEGQQFPGQSGALYEALSDIFAYLISGESIDRVEVKTMREYARLPDCPDHDNDDVCKYDNMGIPKQAVYRMVESGLSRDELVRIIFHALDPQYIPEVASFEEFASGFEAACRQIASKPDLANGEVEGNEFSITNADCDLIPPAFLSVGIGVESESHVNSTNQPTRPVKTSTPQPTLEPVLPLIQKIYDPEYHMSTIINHSHMQITMQNGKCDSNIATYVAWDEFTFIPGGQLRIDIYFCTGPMTFELKAPNGKIIPIELIYDKSYYYHINIKDSDFE